jgi:hypothetical protein
MVSNGIVIKCSFVMGFMKPEDRVITVLYRYHRGGDICQYHEFFDNGRGDSLAG